VIFIPLYDTHHKRPTMFEAVLFLGYEKITSVTLTVMFCDATRM